jgi:hypothetical protein
MDKEKLIKAGIWLSVTVLIITLDAFLLFIGFNNMRHESYTVITIAICLLPILFFAAYMGVKNLLDSIFS